MEQEGAHDHTSSSSSSTSHDSPVDLRPDEEWRDIEPDTEQLEVVSLFDEKSFHNAHEMLEYCKTIYHFDFVRTVRELGRWVNAIAN